MLKKMDANHEEMMAKLAGKDWHWNERRARKKDGSQYKCMPKRDGGLPRKTEACQGCKKPTSEGRESEAEYQEAPTEVATVKSSRIMKKQHRGRHIAAERCGKPEKLTRGDCGSQGFGCHLQEGVPPCSSGRVQVEHFQENKIQGISGPWQELGATGIMMTYRSSTVQGTQV
jgi:hypothetical protein